MQVSIVSYGDWKEEEREVKCDIVLGVCSATNASLGRWLGEKGYMLVVRRIGIKFFGALKRGAGGGVYPRRS